MKKVTGLFPLILLLSACSSQHLLAKYYLFRADEIFYKANYTLREAHKVSFKSREKYFGEACGYFKKAYQQDPAVFTLSRIESADQACLVIKDYEWVEKFRTFQDEYIKKHPMEYEYGEAGSLPFSDV